MACFALTATQRQLLRSCIEIGLEGADENHADAGGENTEEDLNAIGDFLAELEGAAVSEPGPIEITVMAQERSDAITDLLERFPNERSFDQRLADGQKVLDRMI